MAITPSGSHLYLATATPGLGIGRWAIDPGSGALTGGTVEAPPADGYAEAAVATSVPGDALWAPSADGASPAPERIRQFAIGAAGVLTPLAPPAVDYVVAGPARDLVAHPDGLHALSRPGRHRRRVERRRGRRARPSRQRAAVARGRPAERRHRAVAVAGAGRLVRRGPSAAGQVTAFDASASSDPDGTIARYDWDFGDGTSAADAGPTPTHVYTSRRAPAR